MRFRGYTCLIRRWATHWVMGLMVALTMGIGLGLWATCAISFEDDGTCDHDDDGYCTEPNGGMPGGDCCDQPDDPGCAAGAEPAEIYPGAPETCADLGIDNDCDDNTDVEDLNDVCLNNQICPDTQCLCRYGTYQCVGDQLECVPTSGASELCNGFDDNCNNQNDFEDPDAHAACGVNQYCNGQACEDGCDTSVDCTNSNECNATTHQCHCYGQAPCQGNFECTLSGCMCAGHACGPLEECNQDGHCTCGSLTSTDNGEACPDGDDTPAPDCNPSAERCDCAEVVCNEIEACCDGQCVNLGTDENCSGCGDSCTPPHLCVCGQYCGPAGSPCS